MCQLIETIRVLDGEFNNLRYHRARMIRAWKEIFHQEEPWELEDRLREYKVPSTGLYKCRIIYSNDLESVEFIPHQIRPVNSLKLIHDDSISYNHKFKDRHVFDHHFLNRLNCDDILIVRGGLITDTSISNIIFRSGKEYFTPASCLLNGTMRQNLIDQNVVKVTEIRVSDLRSFESFKLINALLMENAPEVDTSRIIQ